MILGWRRWFRNILFPSILWSQRLRNGMMFSRVERQWSGHSLWTASWTWPIHISGVLIFLLIFNVDKSLCEVALNLQYYMHFPKKGCLFKIHQVFSMQNIVPKHHREEPNLSSSRYSPGTASSALPLNARRYGSGKPTSPDCRFWNESRPNQKRRQRQCLFGAGSLCLRTHMNYKENIVPANWPWPRTGVHGDGMDVIRRRSLWGGYPRLGWWEYRWCIDSKGCKMVSLQ